MGHTEVMAGLHPQPEALAEPEETTETQIVIRRNRFRPLTMALMRLSGTPMAMASRYWLMRIGRRNSSSRTSPGATRSVVINDLDVIGAGLRRPLLTPGCHLDRYGGQSA